MINEFTIPSWNRYFKLFFLKRGRISILRELMYEAIKKKKLDGKVLDFGGGDKADYHRFINFTDYESINIDENMNPTWKTKVGETFPCPDDNYDTVFSLNTFEHIFDAEFALKESYRVLKKGGSFLSCTPFLFPIHAYPQDFFRPTDMWWRQALEQAGFVDVNIKPLLWGPFSTGLICSGFPGPFKVVRLHLALILDCIFIKLGLALNKRFINELPFVSLGFMIEGKKRLNSYTNALKF